MKKLLMVATMLFAGLFTYCYGQDVKVNINNQDVTNDDCCYRINGICSSEDIGGVDFQITDKNTGGKSVIGILTNYNPFTVTVLFKVVGVNFPYSKIMSVVIGPKGVKEVTIDEGANYLNFSLEGIIVRKTAQ